MKKFVVTISEGLNGMRFKFSNQDDACRFMAETVKKSTIQVKCTLELEDIINEEKQDD